MPDPTQPDQIPVPDTSGLPDQSAPNQFALENANQAMTPQVAPPQVAPSPVAQPNMLKSLLTNFFAGGARAMMVHAGLPTPEQEQQRQQQQAMQQQNQQSEIQLRQAQAKNLSDQNELVDFGGVPVARKAIPALMSKQMALYQQQATQNPMVSDDMAKALGHPEFAGKPLNTALGAIMSRQDIAAQGNQTKQAIAGQSTNAKLAIAQQSDAYKRWAANLSAQTKMRTSAMSQTKAPAAMMQTATFAQSGLNRLDDAEQAFADLKSRGVLGSVSADKMEDWLFGKGLIDPNLPPADRTKISQLRAALSYTSSAAMRAHTGRTSREIYDDFKTTMGLGQGSDALEGAMMETRKMLGDYAGSASDAAIANMRSGGGGAPQSASGVNLPPGAPGAPAQDGKVLKFAGKVIAKSQGGKWVAP